MKVGSYVRVCMLTCARACMRVCILTCIAGLLSYCKASGIIVEAYSPLGDNSTELITSGLFLATDFTHQAIFIPRPSSLMRSRGPQRLSQHLYDTNIPTCCFSTMRVCLTAPNSIGLSLCGSPNFSMIYCQCFFGERRCCVVNLAQL